MIIKYWPLKTHNQAIMQTENQGNIKFKLRRTDNITIIICTLGAKNIST